MAATQIAYSSFDPSVMPPGWTPNPERIESSLTDYETSTAQTMQLMGRHVREALSDPAVLAIAQRTGGRWGRGPNETRCCWDSFWFCKHSIRFVYDERAVWNFFRESDQVDFLISPSVLIRMKRPAGDCDDFSMLIAALLQANGVDCEFITVACDRSEPNRWSHVYVRAILPDGRHVALDPTSGVYPGWEVPARDVYRKQAWDMSGHPVATVESARPDLGMHRYVGMGDNASDFGATAPTDTGSVMTTLGTDPTLLGGQQSAYLQNLQASSNPASGAGSSINWSTVLNNLFSSGTKLGQEALLPSGSSLLPSGGIISGSGAAAGLLAPSALGAANMGTILLYGGLAIAFAFAISMATKK